MPRWIHFESDGAFLLQSGQASHAPRQDAFAVDDLQSDDHPNNNPDFQCLTDDPLDLALAEWRRAYADSGVTIV